MQHQDVIKWARVLYPHAQIPEDAHIHLEDGEDAIKIKWGDLCS